MNEELRKQAGEVRESAQLALDRVHGLEDYFSHMVKTYQIAIGVVAGVWMGSDLLQSVLLRSGEPDSAPGFPVRLLFALSAALAVSFICRYAVYGMLRVNVQRAKAWLAWWELRLAEHCSLLCSLGIGLPEVSWEQFSASEPHAWRQRQLKRLMNDEWWRSPDGVVPDSRVESGAAAFVEGTLVERYYRHRLGVLKRRWSMEFDECLYKRWDSASVLKLALRLRRLSHDPGVSDTLHPVARTTYVDSFHRLMQAGTLAVLILGGLLVRRLIQLYL